MATAINTGRAAIHPHLQVGGILAAFSVTEKGLHDRTMTDTSERLRHIQEAIARITKYTSQGRETFDRNELVQGWVIHHLYIIGRVAHTIPQDFKHRHSEIPWEQINGMPSVYTYFEINLNRVWSAVEDDLPILKTSIDAILNTEGAEQ